MRSASVYHPRPKTTVDELGAILPDDNVAPRAPIPDFYWNLCAAMYAYVYAELARQGIDVAGESQLVGYPAQFPSVSMVDWNTGQPNARYWVLKLLHDHFGPGDKLVKTDAGTSDVYAQGFVTREGKREILLINKRNRTAIVSLLGAAGSEVDYVDQTTRLNPPEMVKLPQDQVSLGEFAVAVMALKQ